MQRKERLWCMTNNDDSREESSFLGDDDPVDEDVNKIMNDGVGC